MLTFCPILFFAFFAFLPHSSDGTISTAFSQFLLKKFGKMEEQLIARRDMGDDGSFGGGKVREKAKKRPVIFVHGLTNYAGGFDATLEVFRTKGGYRDTELYGTTYSCGLSSWMRDRMECRHIKQLRLLIRAVVQFTHSAQIDLIGYSMGSPIARKAILGGICVDSGEQLGPPLTSFVHTFIGVGGANRGAVHLCRTFGWIESCNKVNGMRCNSRFLDDINARIRYEATARIFTIHSVDDRTVGRWDECEGRPISAIDGQNGEIVLRNYSHQMVIFGTGEQQLQLLTN